MNQPKARQQHYYFVHEYLRRKCLHAPQAALEDFLHERATEHLKIAWVTVGLMHKDPNEEFIPSDEVQVIPLETGGNRRGAILVFPKPERLNEAFMSAVVVDSHELNEPQYFTLEYNPDRPAPNTYIGKWVDESHLNLGGGPEPKVNAFSEVIRTLVEGDSVHANPLTAIFEEAKPLYETPQMDGEARLAKSLIAKAAAKTQYQQIRDTKLSADMETNLLEAENAEALLVVHSALLTIKPDASLDYTGFYLSRDKRKIFRRVFEKAYTRAKKGGDNELARQLGHVLTSIDLATHPEFGDLGFRINFPELPETSEDAFDDVLGNCLRMRQMEKK